MESEIQRPPEYCEYAGGRCDQTFQCIEQRKAFVCYPSSPENIASTIEEAVRKLGARDGLHGWHSWKGMDTAGQVIFCSICKSMRFSDHIIADVTTLNFNLMFEIGYALGLGLPVLPIRDSSYIRDKAKFDEVGMLDTIGYTDFQNSDQLTESLLDRISAQAIPAPPAEPNLQAPLYVIKGPHNTEGELRLISVLKKSWLRFRTYDPLETPRLSLHELRKQIGSSLGLIATLLDPNREGAVVHNARCAIASGIALASAKKVLILQEGRVVQPIDYRDVVVEYERPDQIQKLVEKPMRSIMEISETSRLRRIRPPEGLLEKLDLGDVAAENEIGALKYYFVPTGQFQQARKGHVRLVVGRKGSGKTAIFYSLRNSFGHIGSRIVLDLKPEGHQFTKLREVVLSQLSPGLQEHTLTAFWNSILLAELANKITDDYTWAHRAERVADYQEVVKQYKGCGFADEGDFSERLLNQVNALVERYQNQDIVTAAGPRLTETLFSDDIHTLGKAVAEYLGHKDEVWLLIDNLDKSWPTRGASNEDILILRTLLEATRKLQRQLERKRVDFHCLVFLRNDIYEHLVRDTPDKGKDTAVTLDWSDPELFRQLLLLRVRSSGQLDGEFEDVWPAIFVGAVRMVDSFDYVLLRTLMRPRDFLSFIHRAIEVAVNRRHERVLEEDLEQAERLFSEDMLKSTHFELKDVYPNAPELLYGFLGSKAVLAHDEVLHALSASGVPDEDREEALELLVWFGVLGVRATDSEEERYAYQLAYNIAKLMTPIRRQRGVFVVHPAFRTALECT